MPERYFFQYQFYEISFNKITLSPLPLSSSMYILLNNINIFLPQCLPSETELLFWRVAVNTFTVLCVYDVMLYLLKSNGKMLMKWLSEQSWRCCSCMSSFSETADAEITAGVMRASVCLLYTKPCDIESRLLSSQSRCSVDYRRVKVVVGLGGNGTSLCLRVPSSLSLSHTHTHTHTHTHISYINLTILKNKLNICIQKLADVKHWSICAALLLVEHT